MKTSDSRIKEQHHLISPRHAHEKMSRPLRRRDGVNEYARGNNPQIIVRKVRKYYYLYNVSASTGWSGHIDESVFALSFQENVVVFNEYKDKPTAPFICISLRVSNTNDTGVGIVSVYSYSGSTTTFLKISDETAPHFLLLLFLIRSQEGSIELFMKRVVETGMVLLIAMTSSCSKSEDMNQIAHSTSAAIEFEDNAVVKLCVENFDLKGDHELSYKEASSIVYLKFSLT